MEVNDAETEKWKSGMPWKGIHSDLDSIDEWLDRENKNWKDPKFRNQPMRGTNEGKLRHEVESEWNECDVHEIKSRMAPGGCPLCMLRAYMEEKERIGATGH